ncbi:MAG: hypothetical protein R6Y91_05795 [Desulfohalobium sp.]
MDGQTLYIREPAGLNRCKEPVTAGVPLPRGWIFDPAVLGLRLAGGETEEAAWTPLAWWGDGSIRWVLVDCRISLKPYQEIGLSVCEKERRAPLRTESAFSLWADEKGIILTTGAESFHISTGTPFPFASVERHNRRLVESRLPGMVLTDVQGQQWTPIIAGWSKEIETPFRVVLRVWGGFCCGDESHPLQMDCRVEAWAGQPRLRMEVTVHNPQAAKHPDNTWDLGDPGSIYFQDLRLVVPKSDSLVSKVWVRAEPGSEFVTNEGPLIVYQDSSGGENWRSPNHINRLGTVPVRQQGYTVHHGEHFVAQGKRAQPLALVGDDSGAVGLALDCFWQQFPKSLEADATGLQLGLFPDAWADVHELQAGEKKTHVCWLAVGDDLSQTAQVLDHARAPLSVMLDPHWVCRAEAAPCAVPGGHALSATASEAYTTYERFLDRAVHGARSFFVRREEIDEYGWRHFGDMYADHEAVFHTDSEIFISHYNNQYDLIKGAVAQAWRTQDRVWLRLAGELADHVADIDIYHTKEDRYQYNHGLFWHTDHHLPADKATHRGIAQAHKKSKQEVGGGPAPDHNYATGLSLMYWITGRQFYKEAALELVDNIVQLMRGPRTLVEAFYTRLQKSANGNGSAEDKVYGLWDGPGRASGNALNTLLDGFALTQDRGYMELAQRLICTCVAPNDNIAERRLLDAERRWMYTVFMKALARYLLLKEQEGEKDGHAAYARAVFVHYGLWMVENEYPYLQTPEILEFPNETWAAQELRKSDIFALLGRMVAGALRDQCFERSQFFFQIAMEQLEYFDNAASTRALALAMTNGLEHKALSAQWSAGTLPDGVRVKQIYHEWQEYSAGLPVVADGQNWWHLARQTSLQKEWQWVRGRLWG